MSRHWLIDAYLEGINILDTDEILAAMAAHVTVKGKWESRVISPSLLGTTCPLARVKRFLGHQSQPGQPRMAVRSGLPDSTSNLNFLRGFCMEGVVVAALRRSLGERVVASAPLFAPSWQDPDGPRYAGHPDVMVIGEEGDLELVQIKSPSIFKLDRVKKLGREDAMKSYLPQLAAELFVSRKAGYPVERSNLFLASWEGTPHSLTDPVLCFTLEWTEDLGQMVQDEGRGIWEAAQIALNEGRYPEPYPEHKWNAFPCSYCNYPRLSIFDLKGCTQNEAWAIPQSVST